MWSKRRSDLDPSDLDVPASTVRREGQQQSSSGMYVLYHKQASLLAVGKLASLLAVTVTPQKDINIRLTLVAVVLAVVFAGE